MFEIEVKGKLKDGFIKYSDIKSEIEAVVKDTAEKEARSFRRTVQTWSAKNKPIFRIRKINSGDDIAHYGIFTDSLIYKWVNFGTKPHKIVANGNAGGNGLWLRFQENYKAKTRPGFITARDGGKFGNWVTPTETNHPGIEARRFDEQIAEKQQKRLDDSIEKLLKDLFDG